MNTIENIKEQFFKLQSKNGSSPLTTIEKNAFDAFNRLGVPTSKNEEWKYTRINSLFNKDFELLHTPLHFPRAILKHVRLPGHEEANELVFVNGFYSSSLSTSGSPELDVLPLGRSGRK